MKTGPTISTILACYNAEDYVAETIDSILSQDYAKQEIIVIDDGSSDASLQVIKRFEPHIQVLSQCNQGRSAAVNAAIRKSQGEFLAFCDADDLWVPHKLSQQAAALAQFDLAHTNSRFFGNDQCDGVLKSEISNQHGGMLLPDLLLDNFVTCSSVVMRRSTYDQHGGFNNRHRCLLDWPLWIRVAEHVPTYYDPEPLVHYRVHAGQLTSNVAATIPAHRRVLDDAFSIPSIAKKYAKYRRKAYGNAYSCVAYSAEANGKLLPSLACTAKAIRYQPFRHRLWREFARRSLLWATDR